MTRSQEPLTQDRPMYVSSRTTRWGTRFLAAFRCLRFWASGATGRQRATAGLRARVHSSSHRREEAFTQAKDFRELFSLLDVRQTLWGSQKSYTVQELKILINRVRTQQPTFHLPLVVIPETGGLRQRVQELLEAEAAAERRQEGRR
jgi:hypothetical protein